MNTSNVNEITLPRKAGAAQAGVLIFAAFFPIMAILALAPALPTLMQHFNYVHNYQVLVPMLLTVPALCLAVISPFAGRLTDLWGRRRLFLIAMTLYCIGGMAPFLISNFWAVMAGRFLLGIAEAFILTIANALVADYFVDKDRPKWLAIQGVAGPVLAILVIFLSGYLASKGWQWPFMIYAMALPILIASYFFIYEPEREVPIETRKASLRTFPWKIIWPVYLVSLITAIIYFVQIVNFSLVLTQVGIKDQTKIGIISAIVSIGVPVGALIYKQISGRPVFFLLAVIYFIMGLGYLLIGSIPGDDMIIARAIIEQVAQGMTVPTLIIWCLSLLPEEHRGLGMGLFSTSFFLGQFVSPLVVSMINTLTGGILFTVSLIGIICIATSLFVWVPKFYVQQKKIINNPGLSS